MATNFNWVTPAGTIANFSIGTPSTVTLLTVDTSNTTATTTFNKISGELPPGLALDSSTGVISGTPVYASAVDNYFILLHYDFIVRARTSDGRVLDQNFTIVINNTVNQDFLWVTPAGTLGTVPNGNFYSLILNAQSSNNLGISYSLVSGELPPGMQLISRSTTKTVTFTQLAASNTMTLSDVQIMDVNDYVFGSKIPAGARITNIDPITNEVTISAPTTGISTIGDSVTVVSVGYLRGVPTLTESLAVNESRQYRFTIRATNSLGRITDRAFSLNVTNIYGPIVEPQTVFLGSRFDGTFYNLQLEVLQLNPAVEIEWNITSGSLPPGLQLTSDGKITGYIEPVQLVGQYGPAGYDGTEVTAGITVEQQEYDAGPYQFSQLNQSKAYSFTVQAFDGANSDLQVYILNVVSRVNYTADSSLSIDDNSLTVDSGNVYIPVIRNVSAMLPLARQDAWYAAKIDGYDFDGAELTYSIIDTAGTFDGSNFDPLNRDDVNNGLPGSFDFVTATTSNLPGVGLDSDSGWIFGKIDQQTSAYEEYDFGVKACKTKQFGDGANITIQTNTAITVNTTQYVTQRFANTATAANLQILANTNSTTFYAATIGSGGVPGAPLTVSANNSLWINNVSVTGSTVLETNYYFEQICSPAKFFTLPVLGDPNSSIAWVTPADMGVIENGAISDLQIQATSSVDKTLVYSLIDEIGVSCRLPQGLRLLPTGVISGRATLESFSVDDHATTFDKRSFTVDRTHTFSVRAEAIDNTASVTRIFSIRLQVLNTEPYENLYLQAMPSIGQRNIFQSLIYNTTVFNDTVLYRSDDANFGLQTQLRMLFIPGLTASELSEYHNAMLQNHYTKTFEFGDVRVAYVLDELFAVKYEVLYVEIRDPGENISNTAQPLSVDLSLNNANSYIDESGNQYSIVYPNDSNSMRRRMQDTIGYQDQSSLPDWMVSNQPDVNSVTGFRNPLGYTKAVVLAYIKPNFGQNVLSKIRLLNFKFDQIQFTVDRYQLDNHYSLPYNISNTRYREDKETTFDYENNRNIGTIVATVNYAVVLPYSAINGRPVDFVRQNGAFDGVVNFTTGQTLVFEKQEQFEDAGPYDGWIDYSNAYIGDNTNTDLIEGYDSSGFDTYSTISGFLEKSQNPNTVNRRGGVWRINIVNNVVNLEFVQEIAPYSRIRILSGKTKASAILEYSLNLSPGQTVPFYENFITTSVSTNRTTFNKDSTKFFTIRDQYYEPGTQDKYVKFPQYGVFT